MPSLAMQSDARNQDRGRFSTAPDSEHSVHPAFRLRSPPQTLNLNRLYKAKLSLMSLVTRKEFLL